MTNETINTDVLVIGSGAGGMSAAICAAKSGLKVIIAEKTDLVGGTTAYSGGVPWVPVNHQMRQHGISDSREKALEYLRHAVGNRMRAEMMDVYLATAPKMLEYFEKNTEVQFRIRPDMPDYSSEVPGAQPGRCLETMPFDGSRLGEWFRRLRPPRPEAMIFGGMMVSLPDLRHLWRANRSLASFIYAARMVARHGFTRLAGHHRGTRLVNGNALAARLLKSCLDAGVEIWLEAPSKSLIKKGDRVSGAKVERQGRLVEVYARHGIVMAAGGFPQNKEMRMQYIPFAEQHRSMAPPGNVGQGIKMALEAGAAMDDINDDSAFLTPISVMKNPDGSERTLPHLISDRHKPGAIVVNKAGKRFINEADNYQFFVHAMREQGDKAIPSFLICDANFLHKYGLGFARPWPFPKQRFIDAGYIAVGNTLDELAGRLGVDAGGLKETIARVNHDAPTGKDTEFDKGGSAYNRYVGDRENKPNTNFAAIDKPPYYAIRLQTGDIGTARGVRVDINARALDKDARPIDGLYVCGNDMNSIFAGTYATGGVTLGPALTFGYIAANHIAAAAKGAATAIAPRSDAA